VKQAPKQGKIPTSRSLSSNMRQGVDGKPDGSAGKTRDLAKLMDQGTTKERKSPIGKLSRIMGQ
jgi:hypothetical protein